MKLIKEITDEEVIGKSAGKKEGKYTKRIAARAIILDLNNNIALLSVSKNNYHKLPGGGLEGRENIEEALKREIKEEVGCEIEILEEVGEIIEYKDKDKQKQTSYCYLARLKGEKGKPNFMKEEIERGFILLWIPLKKAIDLMRKDSSKQYDSKFIKLRDYNFLLEAKKLVD
jgi:8-oxo-dGTP diphosphatase